MKGKQGLCRKTTTKKSKIRKIPLMVNLLLMGLRSIVEAAELRLRSTAEVETPEVGLPLLIRAGGCCHEIIPINSRLTIRGIFRILLFFVVVFLHKPCLPFML